MNNLLFYDIEVTAFDALVVFMDINKKEVAHYWSTRGRTKQEEPSGFEDVPDLIRDKTLVGYNNYSYDDIILSRMMNSVQSLPGTLKDYSDHLIQGADFNDRKSPLIRSLDVMQQIDVSHPSLKQIEGNMGISIVESSVDFNIGRPLTDEEREEMLTYCRHDVSATVDIYKLREKSYFEVKNGLVEMLPEGSSENAYRWNTTTLAANILLGDKSLTQWLTINEKVKEEYWRKVQDIPSEVWDMWDDCTTQESVTGKGKSKTIKAYGCNFVFGMGGLHGAPSKPIRCGRVKHKDVASMYPSAIVALNALGDSTDLYDSMRKERISIKKSDPTKAAALKLILNSVYGNFKNKYSSRELNKAGYKIINSNTDGVVYIDDPKKQDMDETISEWWEEAFPGFKLETDYFTKWIQRDVNNYIAVEEDGRITVKGGDVNKYQQNKFFSNNSNRITQIAMVENLVNGTDIFDTFDAHMDEPLLWQFILKAGGTFKGVQNSAGEWQNKVNRVFAAADGVPYTKLYKIRQDDAQVNFPDVPERMYLWNDDVNNLTNFREIVDQGYYYQLVKDKLKGWPKNVY